VRDREEGEGEGEVRDSEEGGGKKVTREDFEEGKVEIFERQQNLNWEKIFR